MPDYKNPVPNIGKDKGEISQEIFQDSSVLSDKLHDVNRAYQTRRDNDKQKDFTITIEDVDSAIFKQIEKFQLTVIDDGNKIKVPVFYASPEKWKSIQKDGAIRDYNGKLILPAIVFERTSSEKDQTMMMFNRYLNYSVIKLYSEKNRYTQFNTLMGKNAPVHEIYDVVMPDHMTFHYHFIIWTEYVKQMNTLIEKFNFETEDYWGELLGFRFRTKIDSFSHTIELQVDQDRMVKTEFDLIVSGYLLPDIINSFKGNRNTTQKRFSPKKIILTEKVVGGNEIKDKKRKEFQEKWKNQNYPNLDKDIKISSPPVGLSKIPTFVPTTTYVIPPGSPPNDIWNDESIWNDILTWND